MNHFQATSIMRKMAEKVLGSSKFEENIEEYGGICEGGQSVIGNFQFGLRFVEIAWDAAWQHFKVLSRRNC